MNLYDNIETENIKIVSITETTLAIKAESLEAAFIIDSEACEPIILNVNIPIKEIKAALVLYKRLNK